MMVIATIMSSIATTVAVVIAVYQYGVARDQLVAADRNRSIQAMTEQVRAICQLLDSIGLEKETAHRPGLLVPQTGSDLKDPKYSWDLIAEDLLKAGEEGRVYYDLDKVRKRKVSSEFREQYGKYYSDLVSSAQTVRLWIADHDIETLQSIKNYALDRLDPQVALPIKILEERADDQAFYKFHSIHFDAFQLATSYCGVLESTIVDWAKGKGVAFPKFTPLPAVTKDEAQRMVRENGKVERITIGDIDPALKVVE